MAKAWDEAEITATQRNSIDFLRKRNFQPPLKYSPLGRSPTKSKDRMEWLIEKPEIGVTQITPLLCQYSRKHIKLDRSKY